MGKGKDKSFCFTVDDNIRFLKEIQENCYGSIFEHPYLAMYQRLHKEFGLCVQLNLFYRMEGFDLSQVSDRYYSEWQENSHWLKLSFHSELESVKPYENAGYDEVYEDCRKTHDQIRRFASPDALANTTTIHYCLLTEEGLRAVGDNYVEGLLGLFGTDNEARTSYGIGDRDAKRIRSGDVVKIGNISFASIDIILNRFSKEEIIDQLEAMDGRRCIRVMIHEQYFYNDYKKYQPEFEEKLKATFGFLLIQGYKSEFYGDLI